MSEADKKKSASSKGEMKAILTFLAVTASYMASWIPFMVAMLHFNFHQSEMPEWLQFVSTWTAISSSWWDVVVLIGMNRGFRQSTWTFLQSEVCARGGYKEKA